MLALEEWIVDRDRREALYLPSGEWVPLLWLYRRARVEGEIIPPELFRVPEPDEDALNGPEPGEDLRGEHSDEALCFEEWELPQVAREEEEWSVLDSNQ